MKKNCNMHPTAPAATRVPAKSSIGKPQAFEPQLNCQNLEGGSGTVKGGWHMRPSIPTRQLGNDYDTLIKPKN